MHNRSIRKNKFNLPSMRKLWKEMGGYDALVEYNECAVKNFIRKWEEAKAAGLKYSDFIRSQAAEVYINLGYINIDQYQQDIYRWYLIHPYGYIDHFIKEFKCDLKSFGFEINLDTPDKSALERLIAGLKAAGISISVEEFKLDLDKYYHRFRNLLAHKLGDKELNKIKNLFEKLPKDRILQFYPSLKEALSEPGVLTFDDYTLCTANLKNITDTITTDVYSALDWSTFEFDNERVKKAIKHFNGNLTRQYNYIKRYIFSQYGIELAEDQLQILYEKFDSIE